MPRERPPPRCRFGTSSVLRQRYVGDKSLSLSQVEHKPGRAGSSPTSLFTGQSSPDLDLDSPDLDLDCSGPPKVRCGTYDALWERHLTRTILYYHCPLEDLHPVAEPAALPEVRYDNFPLFMINNSKNPQMYDNSMHSLANIIRIRMLPYSIKSSIQLS